jgi:uncharacterized protein (DUF2235 family)
MLLLDRSSYSRNLIVCCDGTNNQFGANNTNVVRLVQAIRRDEAIQPIYYDPGLGTLPLPGFVSRIGQRISKIAGLAFGAGLLGKVGDAYRFLMNAYQSGDRVFLFGFSRGAYTIRMLAGLLHMYGLLPRGSENMLPYVLRQYAEARHWLKGDQTDFWNLAEEFRTTFSRDIGTPDRRFPIHFLGVWDTVSSVGWLWDPQSFPFTAANPSVSTVRHAIALDEHRAFYRQNRFSSSVKGQDLMELWFPGVHADVGGGYPESDGGLWREPFIWMLDEATTRGLQVDPTALQRVLARSPVPARPWTEPQHQSLKGFFWRAAEFFPKLHWDEDARRRRPRLGLGRPRRLLSGALLHDSVRRRIRDAEQSYRPQNPGFEDALALVRRTIVKEGTMNRSDFGDWGKGLEDWEFWRAVVVLGLASEWQANAPTLDADLQELLTQVIEVLPPLTAQPEQCGGPLWYVPPKWIAAVHLGDVIPADRLAALFDDIRNTQRFPNRLESDLYHADAELIAALRSAGVCLYHRTPQAPPGDDWQWPLRFTFPDDEQPEPLYVSFLERVRNSQTLQRLTRLSHFGEEPVAEFAIVGGSMVRALARIESSAVPFRAHVILLVDTVPFEPTAETVEMINRLQTLTQAKAVIAKQSGVAEFSDWVYKFVRMLAHNAYIDGALLYAQWELPPPVIFLDPSLLAIARIGRFAERVRAALDVASETPVELNNDEAQPIGLEAGVFTAREISTALDITLRRYDAFDEERRAATWTTQIFDAARRARVLEQARRVRLESQPAESVRRVQIDVVREGKKVRHFRAGIENRIDVFIGVDGGVLDGPPFRDELLPGDESGHLLTVTLTAPGFLEQPQLRTMFLPRRGASVPCNFIVTPGTERSLFDGRISIAYQNRTLQTLRVSGSVVGVAGAGKRPIRLTPEMGTQAGWAGLDSQQPGHPTDLPAHALGAREGFTRDGGYQYGATLTINRLGGESGATLQAGYQVFGFTIEELSKTTLKIESMIDASRWDAPGMQGLDGHDSLELVHFLAHHGSGLWSYVATYAQGYPAAKLVLERLRDADVIQVLSAHPNARLPIEFFYSGIRPSDNATICPSHQYCVTTQECRNCPYAGKRQYFCPAGFWALNRCIEWHQFAESNSRRQNEFASHAFAIEAPDERECRNKLRPITDVVLAASPNATKIDPNCVRELIQRIGNLGVNVHEAADWNDVETMLVKVRPAVLLILPHVTEGRRAQPCLEVGNTTRDDADIEYMDLGAPPDAPGPVVLLIGCSTDNAALPYASFPGKFSIRAPIVVSTISHVLGRHAAPLAGEIVCSMVRGQYAGNTRFSAALRAARRGALRQNLPPVALTLKCYGDARWWL